MYTKDDLLKYVDEVYNISPDWPWKEYDYFVFRHKDNRKWFALFMTIPKAKLKDGCDGSVDALNVKCDPLIIGSMQNEAGVYPAYHMHRGTWLTLALDEISEKNLKFLLDLSFELTKEKGRKK